MKEVDEILEDKNQICWRAIPIQYDNFSKESNDNYDGDIFGNLTMFESPHFLWRRFHKNYFKAIAITKLNNYDLLRPQEHELDDELTEIDEIINKNYSLEILSRHNSLVFLVSALEAFLKDSFCEILLKVYPEKVENQNLEKTLNKFRISFQNIEKINKAFKWLISDFSEINVEGLFDIYQFRHKIIHESFYKSTYSMDAFKIDSSTILIYAHYFECFLNDKGYWDKIKPNNKK